MNILYSIMVSFVWFLSTYFNVVFLLALLSKKGEMFKSPKFSKGENLPKVSIIVPAYNESETISQSISSLKKVDYPKGKLEIIIVNDGSKDNTSRIVNKLKGKSIIFLDNRENKGKAACLNQGISISTGELVACMDADSQVNSDIIRKTAPYFKDEKIGAVTVTVEVKNTKGFLQKIIRIEYIIGLSLALKALSFFNSVNVTPGPFSIYRKKMVEEIGMFDINSITEDLEIAYRIHKSDYKIACCIKAKVQTITPDTFKSLYRQRKRWYSGAIYTLMQHRSLVLNPKGGCFSYIMPYTFLLIFLGLFLFYFSVYLGISSLIKGISFFYLTDFNFLSYMTLHKFDVLASGTLTFFGITALATTIGSCYICLRMAGKSSKKNFLGISAFLLMFFLYQIFWAASIFTVLFRKKVSWR